MTISVRPARTSDISTIRHIIDEYTAGGRLLQKETVTLYESVQEFFVAVESSAIVGTIMAGYDGHRGWLYSVAVDPAKRLSGLGSSLVFHAEKALADLGCMKINLQLLATNEATAAFYKSIGYSVEPRLSMGKLI